MENKMFDELEDIEKSTLDLLAEVYGFSKPFLQGLSTKSENFQNKFFEIIDDICEYFDTDEEKNEFQTYIEENHSYDKPGNVLYSSKVLFCGQQTQDFDELKQKIHFHLLSLFDSFDASDAMTEVPHIIVCLSAPDGCFGDSDIEFIRSLISFERVCRGFLPAAVTTIANNTDNDRGTSCYVAALK